MTSSFEIVPHKKEISLGSSYLKLAVHPESELPKVKKAYPKELFEGFTLSEREPAKAVAFPRGFDQLEILIFIRKDVKTFALHECLRKAFTLDFKRTKRVHVAIASLSASDAERVLHAVGNLLVLAPYEPKKFGKKGGESKSKPSAVQVSIESKLKPKAAEEALQHGSSQGRATNLARHFAELPGNELTPEIYREQIRKLAKDWGAEFKFLDQAALAKRKAGAFLAVVRAIPDGENGIVHLTYRPKGKRSGRKVALVGKGLCFDTGGYNVKVEDFMLEMHRDMTGSAVALALLGHLIEQGTQDEVHCFLALAENLISPTAYRPNDVVLASNGTSIEVVDTDAEGRMVLADTLVYASEQKPDLIVDFATLTGAVVRAIGTLRSGVFSNRDSLRELALRCGEESGERVWGFPIGEDYWEAIQSEIADIRQCSTNNYCDHIYAATFLSAFVKPEIPWIHVDLAADSNKGGLGLSSKDITGFGVRFADQLIRSFKAEKKRG